MPKELPKLSRSPLDDLFSTQEQRDDEQLERVNIVDINDIDNFKNHPFYVRDDAAMEDLVDAIKSEGILMPCIIRPKANGRYEMISGHRRRHAALRLGISVLPCLVRNLSDYDATKLMVLSNQSRPYLLPSEKARSYGMYYDEMKKQAGRPKKNSDPLGPDFSKGRSSDLNLSPVGTNLRSDDELAQMVGESRNQIHRYLRIRKLIPELLQWVDNSVEKPADKDALQMALRPAVELSYLTENNQRTVLEFCNSSMLTPSHAQAIALRKMQNNNQFTAQAVYDLLQQEKPNQKEKVSLSVDKFNRYFPPDTSAKDIEKGIFKALDFYMEAKSREQVNRSAPQRDKLFK